MTDSDIFWAGVSLALFGGMNLAAYRARAGQSWTEEPPAFVAYLLGLLVAGGLFLGNVPKPFAFLGVLLFFATIIHIIYGWIQCWPSVVRRRDERQKKEARERHEAQWESEAREAHEKARPRAIIPLRSIRVDSNGISNVAKQIVDELSRAHS